MPPPHAEYRNSMQGYLDGIQAAVPSILEEPSANVVMDGSMSTFALYWAGSGVWGTPSMVQGGTPSFVQGGASSPNAATLGWLTFPEQALLLISPIHPPPHCPPHCQARPTARSPLPPFPAGSAVTPSSTAVQALATSGACRTDACRRAGKLTRRWGAWGVGCGQHPTQSPPLPSGYERCMQDRCLPEGEKLIRRYQGAASTPDPRSRHLAFPDPRCLCPLILFAYVFSSGGGTSGPALHGRTAAHADAGAVRQP